MGCGRPDSYVVDWRLHIRERSGCRARPAPTSEVRPSTRSSSPTKHGVRVIGRPASARVRVPRDVAIIGFDDVTEARDFAPRLTTIRQPLRQQGRLAGRRPPPASSRRTQWTNVLYLPAELVIRAQLWLLLGRTPRLNPRAARRQRRLAPEPISPSTKRSAAPPLPDPGGDARARWAACWRGFRRGGREPARPPSSPSAGRCRRLHGNGANSLLKRTTRSDARATPWSRCCLPCTAS